MAETPEMATCALPGCDNPVSTARNRFCSISCAALARENKSADPAALERILGALYGGADICLAARAGGLSTNGLAKLLKRNPEFAERYEDAKGIADDRVQTRLYEMTSENVVACIFWLKNRRPLEWRDRKELEVTRRPLEDMIRASYADPEKREQPSDGDDRPVTH